MLMKIFEHLSIIIHANNSLQWRTVVGLLSQTIIGLEGAILSTSPEERQPHDSADSRLSFRGENAKGSEAIDHFFRRTHRPDKSSKQRENH